MKRVLILTLALLISAVLPAHAAFAHVFITDTSNTKGAILHIDPDDDPIAGQPSTLFFDMQAPQSTATLTIATDGGTIGTIDTLNATISGSLATFTYTFPTQGVYELTIKTTVSTVTDVFQYTQRVSRGAAANTLTQPTYDWAEILLIASGIGLAILGIIAFNRRKAIAKQSTF